MTNHPFESPMPEHVEYFLFVHLAYWFSTRLNVVEMAARAECAHKGGPKSEGDKKRPSMATLDDPNCVLYENIVYT